MLHYRQYQCYVIHYKSYWTFLGVELGLCEEKLSKQGAIFKQINILSVLYVVVTAALLLY